MNILQRWKRKLFNRKKLSPLKKELANLKTKIDRENDRLAIVRDRFFDEGGICCPNCGVPGYLEAGQKQIARQIRMEEIEDKLATSSSPITYTNDEARASIKDWINASNNLQPLFVDKIWRLDYLCLEFELTEKQFNAFLDGKTGLKRSTREKVAHWCEINIDSVFDENARIHYRD